MSDADPPSEAYRIRVRDHLDTCWSEWFDGWEMIYLEDGDFTLYRMQVDQSALHGVLHTIRDLNLTLLSVIRIPVHAECPLGQCTDSQDAVDL